VGFKQMLRRRHINADPGGRSVRFLLGVADVVRWPFERFAWLLERRLIWPLRERAAGRDGLGRIAGAGALATLAVGAVAVAALAPSGGDEASSERAASAAPLAMTPPVASQPRDGQRPQGPALHGVPPTFEVGSGVQVAQGGSDSAGEASPTPAPAADGEATGAESDPAESATAASSSSAKPVPAGPQAMKVARRFSEAFVFYEIGERQARAKTVFGETATSQLATALSERPPRQPQGTEVPKARVVNLVPGPRDGKAYTVSVSLLRVGLTSELRLELKKSDGTWQVTDVRG
jgi:hypothetical protein